RVSAPGARELPFDYRARRAHEGVTRSGATIRRALRCSELVSTVLSFDEARERTLSGVEPLGAERVAMSSGAARPLAEPLVARDPIPAQDYSAMDGYAVQSADFSGSGPWRFEVQGVSRTGHAPPPRLVPGTSCRIFTGAALPAGADAVHLQEDAEVLPDGSV